MNAYETQRGRWGSAHWRTAALLAGMLGLLTAVGSAQSLDRDGEDDRDREDRPRQVFYPTDRMISGIAWNIANDYARRHDMDDYQRELTQERFQERLATFFKENRDDIGKAVTYYMEELVSPNPPSADDVSRFAGETLPLMEKFEEQVDLLVSDMSEYLTAEQLDSVELELGAFDVAMGMGKRRLLDWEAGGFDPIRDHPTGGEEFEQAERERHEQTRIEIEKRQNEIRTIRGDQRVLPQPQDASQSERADRATPQTKDEFADLVRKVIATYDLNDGQQAQAWRLYRQASERRDDYLRRNGDRISKIEQRLIAANSSGDERRITRANTEYDSLFRPIETIKKRLEQDLERLPNSAQRRAAFAAGG